MPTHVGSDHQQSLSERSVQSELTACTSVPSFFGNKRLRLWRKMNTRSGRRPKNPEIFRRPAFFHQKTKFFDELSRPMSAALSLQKTVPCRKKAPALPAVPQFMPPLAHNRAGVQTAGSDRENFLLGFARALSVAVAPESLTDYALSSCNSAMRAFSDSSTALLVSSFSRSAVTSASGALFKKPGLFSLPSARLISFSVLA